MRETLNVILNEREGSVPVVRKEESYESQGCNRFFTLCHIAAFRLFHKAFLPPALNDGGRQGVILSPSEGSITVIRKSGYHKENADSLFGSWLKVGDFYEWQNEI